MAVTSTVCGGAATGEEGAAEAAIVAGLLGVVVPTILVEEATAGEVGAAPGDEDAERLRGLLDWSASQLLQLWSEKQLRQR
jgi:hypothetical protein